MSYVRKKKPRRKPFVLTVAQVATAALLPGCFGTSTSNPPPPPDTECPFEEPTSGWACRGDLRCNYGVDASCGTPRTAACVDGQWEIWVTTCNPPPPAVCPELPPQANEPCFGPEYCSFKVDVGCGVQELTATCTNSSWSVTPPICDIPLFCAGFVTKVECVGNGSCRWLVPGCDMPALANAGCFATMDCVTDMDCAATGATCQSVMVDPCYDMMNCNVCSAPAMVCLPP